MSPTAPTEWYSDADGNWFQAATPVPPSRSNSRPSTAVSRLRNDSSYRGSPERPKTARRARPATAGSSRKREVVGSLTLTLTLTLILLGGRWEPPKPEHAPATERAITSQDGAQASLVTSWQSAVRVRWVNGRARGSRGPDQNSPHRGPPAATGCRRVRWCLRAVLQKPCKRLHARMRAR